MLQSPLLWLGVVLGVAVVAVTRAVGVSFPQAAAASLVVWGPVVSLSSLLTVRRSVEERRSLLAPPAVGGTLAIAATGMVVQLAGERSPAYLAIFGIVLIVALLLAVRPPGSSNSVPGIGIRGPDSGTE